MNMTSCVFTIGFVMFMFPWLAGCSSDVSPGEKRFPEETFTEGEPNPNPESAPDWGNTPAFGRVSPQDAGYWTDPCDGSEYCSVGLGDAGSDTGPDCGWNTDFGPCWGTDQ